MSAWSHELASLVKRQQMPVVWVQPWESPRVDVESMHLPAHEREHLHQFRHVGSKTRYLQGRWLVRRTLAELLGCEAVDVPLELDAQGRPHCPDERAPDFNLSHTAGAVAVAFCATHAVGIDVEHTRRRINREGIQKRFFAREEQQWVGTRGDEAFFELWTRKEAMLKASGEGLRGNWSQRAAVTADGGDPEGWRFLTFRICDQVLATIASAPEAGRAQVFHLNADDELEPHSDAF